MFTLQFHFILDLCHVSLMVNVANGPFQLAMSSQCRVGKRPYPDETAFVAENAFVINYRTCYLWRNTLHPFDIGTPCYIIIGRTNGNFVVTRSVFLEIDPKRKKIIWWLVISVKESVFLLVMFFHNINRPAPMYFQVTFSRSLAASIATAWTICQQQNLFTIHGCCNIQKLYCSNKCLLVKRTSFRHQPHLISTRP